ncbi:MAG TPA: 50S ribosomal protein L31 [Candidatus Babeliales bacterium]|nr:50S ribosomal protein L31 [Candidatus Babeliales bacterium]
MKKNLHPEAFEVKAICACGNSFDTVSTESDLRVTLCSACHPYFTGQVKFVDTAGRIERFNDKYSKKTK